MGNYEKWMKSELAFRKRYLINKIDEIERILQGLRFRVENDRSLNDLGELQASGPMLDTAVAAYETQRQALKNYQKMEKQS